MQGRPHGQQLCDLACVARQIAALAATFALIAGIPLLLHEDRPAPRGEQESPGAGADPLSAAMDLDPELISCLSDPELLEADPRPLPSGGTARRRIAALANRVERLRELEFTRPVDGRLLNDREIEARLRELVRESSRPELYRRIGLVLQTLGAIPAQADLLELVEDALTTQVAGLYVPATGELLIRSSGALGPLEEIVLAHELEHALVDQALGLPLPDREPAGRSDSLLARSALAEGDATLTMIAFASRHIGVDDQLSLLLDPAALQSNAGLEDLPDILQREFLFPYLDGLGFVCDLYDRGGWRAVDRAYRHPPRTSAEIIFPARYGDRADHPPPTGSLAGPWRRTHRDQLGAAQLEWMFAAPGGDAEAGLGATRELVEPWSGGELQLWEGGQSSAVALSIAERDGADGLCTAMLAWYRAAFPDAEAEVHPGGNEVAFQEPTRAATVRCDADGVRAAIAPSASLASQLAG
jgi:hypothetical protein